MRISLLCCDFIPTPSKQRAPLDSFSPQDSAEVRTAFFQCSYAVCTQTCANIHPCVQTYTCVHKQICFAFGSLGFPVTSLAGTHRAKEVLSECSFGRHPSLLISLFPVASTGHQTGTSLHSSQPAGGAGAGLRGARFQENRPLSLGSSG